MFRREYWIKPCFF